MAVIIEWAKKILGIKPSCSTCSEEGQCLELLRVVMDEEATEEEIAYVKKHIEVCHKCYNNYDLEKAIRKLIHEKTEQVTVPQDLIDGIKEKIKSDNSQV